MKTNCIEWSGCKTEGGYGHTRHDGRQIGAHRLAYIQFHGIAAADIKGLVVRHKCDNRGCVNPEHLEIGTHKDNTEDMIKRNRQVILRGAELPTAKLTDAAVRQIRERLSSGETQKSIADAFGVDPSLISHVKRGKIWGHVQ